MSRDIASEMRTTAPFVYEPQIEGWIREAEAMQRRIAELEAALGPTIDGLPFKAGGDAQAEHDRARIAELEAQAERDRAVIEKVWARVTDLEIFLLRIRDMFQGPDGPIRGYWRGNTSRRMYQQITDVLGNDAILLHDEGEWV